MTDQTETRPLETMDTGDIFDELHGYSCTIHGLRGTIKAHSLVAKYPREELVDRLHFNPDTYQPEYQRIKAKYQNDWYIDLTDNIETYCQLLLDKRAQVTARNARIMPVNAWGSIPTAEPQPEQPKHGPFTTTYPIP